MLRAALWSALPVHPQSGFLHTNKAWVSRLPGVVKPQAEQRREVLGAGTLARAPPRRASLYVSRVTVRPHASQLIERFSPAFRATFVPGSGLSSTGTAVGAKRLILVEGSVPVR